MKLKLLMSQLKNASDKVVFTSELEAKAGFLLLQKLLSEPALSEIRIVNNSDGKPRNWMISQVYKKEILQHLDWLNEDEQAQELSKADLGQLTTEIKKRADISKRIRDAIKKIVAEKSVSTPIRRPDKTETVSAQDLLSDKEEMLHFPLDWTPVIDETQAEKLRTSTREMKRRAIFMAANA